jgi:hypothetical protein
VQISIKVVAGVISFCLGTSSTGLSGIYYLIMIGEINRKRQEGNLMSYFCGSFKMLEILSEYRRLYPGGKLHIYALVSTAIGMIGMISFAVCLFTIR